MEKSAEKKKKFQLPSALVLLFVIIIIAGIATYFVPAGQYDKIQDAATGRMIADPSTYHNVEQNPVSLFKLFMSVPLGMQQAGSIIFFMLIIGGAMGIMTKTGAIDVGLGAVVKKMAGKEALIVPVVMFIFSLGGAFIGMCEETLLFIPLMVSICVAMGFDSITGTAILFLGAGAGFSGALTNAFTIGVAQGISGLPLFSGIGLRFIIYCTLTLSTIIYVYRYAVKIKNNPELSSMHEEDKAVELHVDLDNLPKFTTRHKLVLGTFAVGVVALIIGVLKFGFYIDELSTVFLIVAIVAGLAGGLSTEELADEFVKGAGTLLYAGIIIGFSRAATVILNDGLIMDTIIKAMADSLNGLPATISAVGMFVVQSLFNILVPSGSGSAAVTMPIMAPLSDLLGVTRQTAVLAYQFGDAYMNVIAPTSGPFMAAIAMSRISYSKWVKWIMPLFLIWCLIAVVFLVIAVNINYGPF